MSTVEASTTTHTVLSSVDDLLADATSRVPFNPGDGLSNVPMERVVIAGESHVAKWIGPHIDWVSRATGDTLPEMRVSYLWRTGLLDRMPAEIEHTLVGVAHQDGLTVLLMRDVGPHFLDEGHIEIPSAQHRRFLDHMAAMHVAFWGFEDLDGALCTTEQRYQALSTLTADNEEARGTLEGVPSYLRPGWDSLDVAVPVEASTLRALATDPRPLARAMAVLPQTLVHGDWKAGNLGSLPDGRTILVDYAWPGPAVCTVDLAWYLAVNSTRLPESREATIDAYRSALEARGINTAAWWDRALQLALLGALLQLGWSKTEEPEELAWWIDRARPALRELG
jgi:hypothetical protein